MSEFPTHGHEVSDPLSEISSTQEQFYSRFDTDSRGEYIAITAPDTPPGSGEDIDAADLSEVYDLDDAPPPDTASESPAASESESTATQEETPHPAGDGSGGNRPPTDNPPLAAESPDDDDTPDEHSESEAASRLPELSEQEFSQHIEQELGYRPGTGARLFRALSRTEAEQPNGIIHISHEPGKPEQPIISIANLTGKLPNLERTGALAEGMREVAKAVIVSFHPADPGEPPAVERHPVADYGSISERLAADHQPDTAKRLLNRLVDSSELTVDAAGAPLPPSQQIAHFIQNRQGLHEWVISIPNLAEQLGRLTSVRQISTTMADAARELVESYAPAEQANVSEEAAEAPADAPPVPQETPTEATELAFPSEAEIKNAVADRILELYGESANWPPELTEFARGLLPPEVFNDPEVAEMAEKTVRLATAVIQYVEEHFGPDAAHPGVISGTVEKNVPATYHGGTHTRDVMMRGALGYALRCNQADREAGRPETYSHRNLILGLFLTSAHDAILGYGRGVDERLAAELAVQVMDSFGALPDGFEFTEEDKEIVYVGDRATAFDQQARMQAVGTFTDRHLHMQISTAIGDLFTLTRRDGPARGAELGIEDLATAERGYNQILLHEAEKAGFDLMHKSAEEIFDFIDRTPALVNAFATYIMKQESFYRGHRYPDERVDEWFPGRMENADFNHELAKQYLRREITAKQLYRLALQRAGVVLH